MAGEMKKMQSEYKNYSLGRFSFITPESMKLKSTKFVVGYANVQEIPWTSKAEHESERDKYWKHYLTDVKSEIPPDGVEQNLLDEVDLSENKLWRKGALYHSNRINKKKIQWAVLTDQPQAGLLVSIEGGLKFLSAIKKGVTEISDAYIPFSSDKINQVKGDKYYTEYGVFNFPFDEAEELYARFEAAPEKLKLTIKSKVVSKVEKTNLIERLNAAIATNFAPGVSVDKIRTGQRKVAGLEGDEVIMRGTEGKKSELSFAWRFNGEKNSATAPRITIEMESPDGQLDEKMAIWDAVLNSMVVIPQE